VEVSAVPPNETPATQTNPKRAMILRQAIEVFARDGFRHADVQAIADRAGVGKGTVYRNFASKEELFNAATYEVLSKLERYMFAAVEGLDDPLQILYALGTAHTRFFQQNGSYLEIFVQHRAEFRGSIPAQHDALHEQMIRRLVTVVERGVADGLIAPGDPRTIVMSLGTVLYGTIMFGCHVADEYSLLELGEQSLQRFLRGIRADGSGTRPETWGPESAGCSGTGTNGEP
jgi:AcrR family transcriptional regulator